MHFNIIGFLIFASLTCFTPGPNNYLLFSYGKSYGLREAKRLMSGIVLGFFTLIYLAGYGIAGIITGKGTIIGLILKIACSGWLIYLAFAIRDLNRQVSVSRKKRIGPVQGFFMQFANPKAWIMAIAGAGGFMPKFDNIHLDIFVFAILFCVIGIASMITWTYMGEYISRILKSGRTNKIVGNMLFVLMIAAVITIWI